MNTIEIKHWLEQLSQLNQGQLVIVQTIRNGIMAASILASVTLIALMGALATAHNESNIWILSSIALLVMSATCSAIAISNLARLSFQTQFEHIHFDTPAARIRSALNLIAAAALLFILALTVAAMDLFV